MKKLLTYTVGLGLLLVGCTKNETFNENETPNSIKFSSYTGVTRVAPVTTTGINEFGILGHDADGTVLTNLNNNQCTKGGDGKWKPASATAYWPSQSTKYPVTFYAYYPWTPSGTDYTVPSLDYNATTVIYTINDYDKQKDHLAATASAGITDIHSAVSLTFKHMLSQIKFKVAVAEGYSIRIAKIELEGISKTASFDFANADQIGDGSSTQSGLWTSHNTSHKYDFGIKAFQYCKETASTPTAMEIVTDDTNNNLMLIPQMTTGASLDGTSYDSSSGAHILVTYQLYEEVSTRNLVGKYYDGSGNALADNNKRYVKAAFPLDLANFPDATSADKGWHPGKTYTYVLKFGLGGNGGYNANADFYSAASDGTSLITISAATGETVTTPGGTNIAPGEPVLTGQPINFDVNVDLWDAYNTDGIDVE